MNTSALHTSVFLIGFCLRFRYPRYFILPSRQIYAVHRIIEFLKIFKPQKIDFFLVAGCLLGAVRQGSFAGRPSDIDFGIKEEELPKLLKAIPLLRKSGARFIRSRPYNKLERLQILFPCMLVDIGIYRKKNQYSKYLIHKTIIQKIYGKYKEKKVGVAGLYPILKSNFPYPVICIPLLLLLKTKPFI